MRSGPALAAPDLFRRAGASSRSRRAQRLPTSVLLSPRLGGPHVDVVRVICRSFATSVDGFDAGWNHGGGHLGHRSLVIALALIDVCRGRDRGGRHRAIRGRDWWSFASTG